MLYTNFDLPSRNQIHALVRSFPPNRFGVDVQATSVYANMLQSLFDEIKDVVQGVTATPLCRCANGGRISATVTVDFGGKTVHHSSLQQALNVVIGQRGDMWDDVEDAPENAVKKALKGVVRRYRGRRSGTEQQRLEEKRARVVQA